MSGAEGFLGRWSRRKRAAAASGLAPAEAPLAPAAEAEASPPAEAPPAEAEPFDPDSLPPPESLGLESDLSPFLRPQVPAALRNAALRRIWSLDPGIRDFIGPADYAWDYNAPDGVPGFALELGEDARRLLAQAIGRLGETEGEPEAAGPEAPLPIAAAAAPSSPAGNEPPLTGTDPAALAEVAPSGEEIVISATIPPVDPPPPSVPRRRHGGAVPS